MNLHTWWIFAVGTFIICGTPGPNMLIVMRAGIDCGPRRAIFTMAGCFLSLMLFIITSLAGVGALLKTSPELFNAMRYAGAAYLIYIGAQSWRSKSADADNAPARIAATSPKRLFRTGFLVGISNPKAILSAAAFFPQFLDPSLPQLPQMAILVATAGVLEIGWYMVYALSGHRFAALMKQARVRQTFFRFTGTLFIIFGMLLFLKSP